jgi:predicted nucleic acid-binding protein
MAIFIDTNILIYALKPQSNLSVWAIETLRASRKQGSLLIDPIVYAELSGGFESQAGIDQALGNLGIKISHCTEAALFAASRAFKTYKARGGTKSNVLSDFLIGANANARQMPLITRDVARYQTYFPTLQLIAPPV